jgi:hypothetical protein
MAKKKEASEGSLTGSILLGGVSAIIGMSVAVVSLLSLDVAEVKEIPEEEEFDSKAVYYIAGSQRSGSAWKSKRAVLLRGSAGTLKVKEGELNSWVKSSFKPDPKSEEATGGVLGLAAEQVNFRLTDGQMQVSARVKSTLIPGSKSYLFQATGNFEKDGEQFAFVPTEAMVGTCPLPAIGGVASTVLGLFLPTFLSSEEFTELNPSWAALSEVTIAGDQLNLVHP